MKGEKAMVCMEATKGVTKNVGKKSKSKEMLLPKRQGLKKQPHSAG